MNKWVNTVLCVLVLAGVVFAMTGATVVHVQERGRWSAGAAGSAATEGGNISGVNVSSTSLTDRWASFYGNVTGSIILTDSGGTNNVYSWSWAATDGGEVCLSQDTNFPWGSAETAVKSAIDTAFGFGSVADNADNTYADGGCNIATDEVGSITTTGTSLMGNSSFENCVLGDGVELVEGDFAFCTNISNSGTNWNNEPANYEVMVPTTVNGTETYYFFVELN